MSNRIDHSVVMTEWLFKKKVNNNPFTEFGNELVQMIALASMD